MFGLPNEGAHPVDEPIGSHEVVPLLHPTEKFTAPLGQDESDVRKVRMMLIAIGGAATEEGKPPRSNGSTAMLVWEFVQQYLGRQLSNRA
jgi:hypothetical protein